MNDQQAKLFYLAMGPRQPYVRKGQVVNYVGLERGPRIKPFLGGKVVLEVGEWCPNLQSYVVRLCADGIIAAERYMDTELSCFHEEVYPKFPRFWAMPISKGFNSLHEFVRWKRKVDKDAHTSHVLKQYGRLAS